MSADDRARERRLRLVRALGLGALALVLALAAGARLGGPLAILLALLALSAALHAELALVARRARTALPARLPRAAETEHPGRLARLASAVLLAGLLLVTAPLLAVLGTSVSAGLGSPEEPGRAPEATLAGARTPAGRSATPGSSAREPGFAGTFPASVEWATARPLEDDTPVLVVRPAQPVDDGWRALEPLYLRGRVLERFTASGLAAAPGEAVELDARRAPDGWSSWLAAPADGVHELALEQLPVRVAGEPLSLLFAPAGLAALDCPGARATPDGALQAPLPAERPLRFRTRSLERRFERTRVPDDAERDVPRATLALPPPSPELEALRALAAELTRGAANDRERVALLLAYFRTEFRHEPEPDGIAGLAGLARFVERRAGGCTHFAAAAALMLRTLGVPARVVTGFLARLPEPEAEAFVATPRGGHAWLEVCFAQLGWVTCDPTPGGARSAEDAPLASTGPRRAWTGSVDFLASFLGGEPVPWRRLRGTGLELWTRLGARAWLLGLVPVAALVWLALRRHRRSPAGASAGRAHEPGDSALERLRLALARAGVPRPPARTLREHAHALVARTGPALLPLATTVETLYRTRFGGVPWSRADEEQLAHALRALDALNRRAPD